jgi:hypothetical protein
MTLAKLCEHLPTCLECEAKATYKLSDGPFYCDLHAAWLTTAVELPYAKELRLLGV